MVTLKWAASANDLATNPQIRQLRHQADYNMRQNRSVSQSDVI